MTILLLASMLCVGALAYIVADLASSARRERDESLRRAAGRDAARALWPADVSRADLADPVARFVRRLVPGLRIERVALRLHAAGLAHRVTPDELLAAKAALAALGLAIAFVIAVSGADAGHVVVIALSLLVVGWRAPEAVVRARSARRRAQILPQLPDALDLLAVSVEAGLTFDAAVQRLVEQLDGPLIDELELTLSEMRVGESRRMALQKLAERVRAQELTTAVRAIIQADQQGSSLGRILRIQAADARTRRQIRAEERANKAPVHMLFPTVFFIFPSLFVVILGPALLTIWNAL